jgi:transcription elongation factor Elf1
MNFKKVKGYKIRCSICGQYFTHNDDIETMWLSKEEAISDVIFENWKVEGEYAFCPTCQSQNKKVKRLKKGLQRATGYLAVCSKCGKVYDETIFFATKREGIDVIEMDGLWWYKNGKILCDDCY